MAHEPLGSHPDLAGTMALAEQVRPPARPRSVAEVLAEADAAARTGLTGSTRFDRGHLDPRGGEVVEQLVDDRVGG